jgi:hypothetical protein
MDENGASPLNKMPKKTSKRKTKPAAAGEKPHPKLPNREAIISKMARAGDSGRILEEDRS